MASASDDGPNVDCEYATHMYVYDIQHNTKHSQQEQMDRKKKNPTEGSRNSSHVTHTHVNYSNIYIHILFTYSLLLLLFVYIHSKNIFNIYIMHIVRKCARQFTFTQSTFSFREAITPYWWSLEWKISNLRSKSIHVG